MSIKKLQKDSFNPVRIKLSLNDALFVVDYSDHKECLLLNSPTSEDFSKMEKLETPISYKYIGDELVFKQFQKELNWEKLEKSVFIEKEKEVIYYPNTARVRFEKTIKKNVLIVDDSKVIQKLLSKIVNQSKILNLIGVANCPSEAKELIEQNEIDLITLDIHMPEMNGVEFLKTYLGRKNIPTVLISSVSMEEGPLIMEGLSSGASTYIQKPTVENLEREGQEILAKLEAVALKGIQERKVQLKKIKLKFESFDGIIAIGSSTGGTQALQEIFTQLPKKIPPILVVQHIPAFFSKALADRLNTLCPFEVKEAVDNEIINENTIYIAPGGKQMKIMQLSGDNIIKITDDPKVNGFQPSVDYMFHSLSKLSFTNVLGMILTGMGKDGAQGLLDLKNNGAVTIAQDEASSIVFGMPKQAIEIGAVDKVVALHDIPQQMIIEFNRNKNKKAA